MPLSSARWRQTSNRLTNCSFETVDQLHMEPASSRLLAD
jgi:hypothetical protein